MRSGSRVQSVRETTRESETTLRYTVSGPPIGPALVLVHGWACERSDFDAVTNFLPASYRVIAVNLAEHGESRSSRTVWTMEEFARDVGAVMRTESVSDAVLVGHSLGGAVAVEVARLLPAVVSRVVALDALHYLFLFPALGDAASRAVMEPFHSDFPAAVRAMVDAGSPPDTERVVIDGYVEKMSRVRQPAGLRSLEGLVRWDMDAALADVDQPIDLIAVRQMVSRDAIERYGRRLSITLADLGSHHFLVESPGGTAEILIRVVGDTMRRSSAVTRSEANG